MCHFCNQILITNFIHLIITSEVFSFEVLLQWSDELEVTRCKVRERHSQWNCSRSCVVTSAVWGWALSWSSIIFCVSQAVSTIWFSSDAVVLCGSCLHSLLPHCVGTCGGKCCVHSKILSTTYAHSYSVIYSPAIKCGLSLHSNFEASIDGV
jgi:hypothetical protein